MKTIEDCISEIGYRYIQDVSGSVITINILNKEDQPVFYMRFGCLGEDKNLLRESIDRELFKAVKKYLPLNIYFDCVLSKLLYKGVEVLYVEENGTSSLRSSRLKNKNHFSNEIFFKYKIKNFDNEFYCLSEKEINDLKKDLEDYYYGVLVSILKQDNNGVLMPNYK